MVAIPADVGGRDSRTKICQAQGEVVGTMPRRNRSQGTLCSKIAAVVAWKVRKEKSRAIAESRRARRFRKRIYKGRIRATLARLGDASRGQRFIPEMQRIQG
jgi:hypothetical protein